MVLSVIINWAGENLGVVAYYRQLCRALGSACINVVDNVRVHEMQMLEVDRGRGSRAIARAKGRCLIRVVL